MSDETKEMKEEAIVDSTEKNVKPIDDVDELRGRQVEETARLAQEYNAIFEELEKGGYLTHGYDDEAVVVIPAQLFSSFVNFVNAQMQTLHTVGSTIEILQNTNDAIITNLSEMTIRLMRQHKANVDSGATLTSEELDKKDAKKQIKKVPQTESKKKTKKARGSKT